MWGCHQAELPFSMPFIRAGWICSAPFPGLMPISQFGSDAGRSLGNGNESGGMTMEKLWNFGNSFWMPDACLADYL
jgi:hypothetical protein